MMLKIRWRQIYCFFLIFGGIGCQGKKSIDISHIDLKITIDRFDHALDSLTQENILIKNKEWKSHYSNFYYDYMQHMLNAGDPDDSITISHALQEIIATPDYHALKNSVQKQFPSLTPYEENLTDAFKYILYYFPEAHVPRFISFFSGFSVQTPIGKNYMGIGLDMFLGADSEFYPALRSSIPFYISRRFTPDNIVPRTVETYLREELFPYQEAESNLLHQMIHHGKILYALDNIMPDVADTLKIGYTSEQMAWAKTYEKDIWGWFLSENLLYEYDFHRIQKYIGEAPFTPELGEQNESAPKLGVFIGWQIVRTYMKKHPDTSLLTLMSTHDAQVILDGSGYRGR